MFKLKERPPVAAIDYVSCLPSTYIETLEQKPDGLAVRAAVFRTIHGCPYVLILKRSETDSLPGRWELPGGGLDTEDKTIRDAITRELKEETGLTAAWMTQEVGHGTNYQSRRNGQVKNMRIVTFVVEVDEIGRLEHAAHTDVQKSTEADSTTTTNLEGTPTSCADAEHVPVTLNPAEHSKYLWVKQEAIESRRVQDEKLTFTSDDTKTVLLQAFELQKFIIEAKAGI